MQKGDIILAKQGPKIVGQGFVTGSYRFDDNLRIVDPDDTPWSHQVPVQWKPDFSEVGITIGDQQRYTVRKLTRDDYRALENRSKALLKQEALEGQINRRELVFRRRNSSLIQAKKANSDYRCEVCDFSFEEAYGPIGHEYIVAHHVEPLSNRSKPSMTSLGDIALLCANCHAMVHTSNPPLSLDQLRRSLRAE